MSQDCEKLVRGSGPAPLHATLASASRSATGSGLCSDEMPPSRRVGKRLASSPFFAAITLIHQTNAHMTGQLRNTQDVRQRFSRLLFHWKRVAPRNREGAGRRPVCGGRGVGLEPTSPFGQQFSSYGHTGL